MNGKIGEASFAQGDLAGKFNKNDLPLRIFG
jgi:hypothetical protein